MKGLISEDATAVGATEIPRVSVKHSKNQTTIAAGVKRLSVLVSFEDLFRCCSPLEPWARLCGCLPSLPPVSEHDIMPRRSCLKNTPVVNQRYTRKNCLNRLIVRGALLLLTNNNEFKCYQFFSILVVFNWQDSQRITCGSEDYILHDAPF